MSLRSTGEPFAHPLVMIDGWGERLRGGVACNQWVDLQGNWERLPEADIEALRGICCRRPSAPTAERP